MKNFKQFIKEDALDDRLAASKKRIENEENLEQTLKKHYTGLEPHHDTLHDFTYDSRPINSPLWKLHKGEDVDYPKIREKINKMDSIVNKHKTTGDMIVYSKSRRDPRELKNSESIVHHPAFLSTSIKKDYVENNYLSRNREKKDDGVHHHFWQIHVPKGNKGVFIPDEHSIDNRAKEFVLPRGSNLKYIDTDTKEDKNIHTFYHYHKLDVINS
jgi:hypothetical protein